MVRTVLEELLGWRPDYTSQVVNGLEEWRLLCRMSLEAQLSREGEKAVVRGGAGWKNGFFELGKALSMFC